MTNHKLVAVGVRLEESVSQHPLETDPLKRYLLYEQMAIEILDGEFADFPDGELEQYLLDYLARKRGELDINEGELP